MSIESYHLQHGQYPSGKDVHVATLVGTLITNGDLSKRPLNVFTGNVYVSTDSKGKMVYSNTTRGYLLTVYGADGSTIVASLTH